MFGHVLTSSPGFTHLMYILMTLQKQAKKCEFTHIQGAILTIENRERVLFTISNGSD